MSKIFPTLETITNSNIRTKLQKHIQNIPKSLKTNILSNFVEKNVVGIFSKIQILKFSSNFEIRIEIKKPKMNIIKE